MYKAPIALEPKTIVALLGAWKYPIRKRITRGAIPADWHVSNVTQSEQFYRAIEISGIYTCAKRSWILKDKFELVSLEIKVEGKTILKLVSPEKLVPTIGKLSKPLKPSDVKDEYMTLAEIFKKFVVKA